MAEPLWQRAALLYHFARTRYGGRFTTREQLLTWQARQLQRFLTKTLPRAPFYRGCAGAPLAQLPIVNKAVLMAEFSRMNTRGISLDAALEVAWRAEQSRDFAPLLDDLAVGLSSGTSGQRGVFLVSPAERAQWAGLMFAKALPPGVPRALLTGKLPQLRIAFFLRANNNLYTTLGQGRVRFEFYDLWEEFATLLPRLHAQQPHLLVAPAQVLRLLAAAQQAGQLQLQPLKIFSVAEVLDPQDEQFIRVAFGLPVAQIYQSTEGFLGITCPRGTLHLNEEWVHFEPQWLDAAQTRFVPLVTDFNRTTQLIVRYRLDDVLRPAVEACACGNPARAIAAIEGRADDVLYFRAQTDGSLKPIFADFIRRAFLLASPDISEYQATQCGELLQLAWHLQQPADEAQIQRRLRAELVALCQQTGTMLPQLEFVPYQELPLHAKRRRIRRQLVQFSD